MPPTTPSVPDPLLSAARQHILAQQNPSISFLQRRLYIDYRRALALMQQLEGDVVSAPNAAGGRQILPTYAQDNDERQGDGLAFFGPHQRLCFYPSCWHHALWVLLRLDCDLFVLAEQRADSVSWRHIESEFKQQGLPIALVQHNAQYLCFTSQGKTVWIFFEDNNVTLRRIRQLGLTIHHFVGICDGCAEGGNYECVHEKPFLQGVLAVAAPVMLYTTDHSRPLDRQQRAIHNICGHQRFVDQMAWSRFPPPPDYQRNTQQHPQQIQEVWFELQGVLVAPQLDGRQRCQARDLVVLPKGPYPTQLDCLKPFRTRYYRGVLAEYRVVSQPD